MIGGGGQAVAAPAPERGEQVPAGRRVPDAHRATACNGGREVNAEPNTSESRSA